MIKKPDFLRLDSGFRRNDGEGEQLPDFLRLDSGFRQNDGEGEQLPDFLRLDSGFRRNDGNAAGLQAGLAKRNPTEFCSSENRKCSRWRKNSLMMANSHLKP